MNQNEIITTSRCIIPTNKSSSANHILADDAIGFNYEIKRIQSFASWPVHYPVDPVRLSKSGFYYTGNADEVVCFSCHGHIKNWQYGVIVQKKHTELFPHCDFVNKKSDNVPTASYKTKCANKFVIKNNTNGIPKIDSLSSSENYSQTNCLPNLEVLKDNVLVKSDLQNLIKMKSEEERFKTFSNRWPLPFIDVTELVKAGFFYLGYGDKVQCPFCQGIVSNWEDGDAPLDEHSKHFPWCDYLTNIGCVTGKNKKSWYKNTGHDICGSVQENSFSAPTTNKCKLLDKNQQHTNLKNLGIHLHNGPVHSQQASLAARQRSFIAWSSAAPVRKEDLANAGFFYIGISDHTKCFHCDGGLCNWEKGDDPWVEHARWFCNCDFVRLNKGDEFIESCKENHPTVTEMERGNSSTSQPKAFSSAESLITKVDEAMKSKLIAYIVDNGLFPSYVVRVAVLRQIKETGSSFSDIDEMCKAVSYLTEEMESKPFKITDTTVLNLDNLELQDECNASLDQECPDESSEGKLFQRSESNLSNDSIISSDSEGKTSEDESRFLKDQCLCKVCMDKEVGVVFLPCGHLLTCTLCAPALKICPMCRKTIQATVRAYLP